GCARQMMGANRTASAPTWTAERARLAITNFACAMQRSELRVLTKGRCRVTAKTTHGRRMLPGTNQTGRFCITSYLQLRESDLYGRGRIAQLSFFFLRRSFFGLCCSRDR